MIKERDGEHSHDAAVQIATTQPFTVGFQLAAYDTTKPLIIDPVLVYSTYLGGSTAGDVPGKGGGTGFDVGQGIAVDSGGNVYVTGTTGSLDFPTVNAIQPNFNSVVGGGNTDAFITKINAAGTAIVYSTYLGGSGDESVADVAVDATGDVYVAGSTNSTNFPTANPVQPSNAGESDVFIVKLNASGAALVYSTYLGGSALEGLGGGISMAVDSAGNVYVVGGTNSTNFPIINAIQPKFAGGFNDAFVLKLNAAGSALLYSTFLGGSESDSAASVTVDGNGNVYVTGSTDSSNFPTVNPIQPNKGNRTDGFISKLNAAGNVLTYSTYIGGSNHDYGSAIAVDSRGNAYIAGSTSSVDFPTVNPIQPNLAGGVADAFITKVNAAGTALVYSTYLGGNGADELVGRGIAVDLFGNVYLTGLTESTNFPMVNALQPKYGGVQDGFVTKINAAGTALVYSSYLGGNQLDRGRGIAVDTGGNIYVTGQTASSNFPIANALQAKYAGGLAEVPFDAFIAKISQVVHCPANSLQFAIDNAFSRRDRQRHGRLQRKHSHPQRKTAHHHRRWRRRHWHTSYDQRRHRQPGLQR